MSSHTRTTIRAIEPAPSSRSRRTSGSFTATNRSSLSSPRSTLQSGPRTRYTTTTNLGSQAPSYTSRSSRHSRRQSLGGLVLPSQAGVSLPRSPASVVLPSSRRGSKVTISVTSPVETVHATSRSRRDAPPTALRRRTTETFVFSPRDPAPIVSTIPPSSRYSSLASRPSVLSSRSSRSYRPQAIMPAPSKTSSRSNRTYRSQSISMVPPQRSSLSAALASRDGISASTAKASSRHSSRRMTTQFDDLETLAPEDSISQVSGPSRRSKRSSRY